MIPVSEVGKIKIAILNKLDAIKKELESGSLDVQKVNQKRNMTNNIHSNVLMIIVAQADVYSLGIVAIKMMIKHKFVRLYR